MKTHLKIKIKSLAAEAKIIKHEEKKWPGPSDIRYSLYRHRVGTVRKEARHSLLAYGFLRGRNYRRIENKNRTKPDWEVVENIAIRFSVGEHGPKIDKLDLKQKFEEWVQEAK